MTFGLSAVLFDLVGMIGIGVLLKLGFRCYPGILMPKLDVNFAVFLVWLSINHSLEVPIIAVPQSSKQRNIAMISHCQKRGQYLANFPDVSADTENEQPTRPDVVKASKGHCVWRERVIHTISITSTEPPRLRIAVLCRRGR